ncbi:MAG TPA: PQQ-dependent dehydrogenase, methanol/ethanol family [Terriglobia bacterium]|nr:PQQ-dependent dehydrogenase, methanol/ethanol family [Terriglobia bacterium]
MYITRLKWMLPAVVMVIMTGVLAGWQRERVNYSELKKAGEGTEWLTYGHTFSEQRYSPLKQIDEQNVGRLGLAWSREVGEGGGPQEATPLFANGVLYGITNWSITFAVDARTGQELWRHDPQVAPGSVRLCCGVISRGLALYQDKVIVPVVDGRLVALDAATGRVIWSVFAVPEAERQNYSMTMAPRVFKNKVIIGNAGAEFAPYRGYLAAYNVNTGKELWRFHTVPGDPSKPFENDAMEAAAKTWAGEWWKYGGGGSIWDGMAYDPDTDLVYVGTGNGLPWPQEIRQGKAGQPLDNLYVASILAIDLDSGKLKWHFQCTPGDEWDFDAVQHLMLADIQIRGVTRKVIMQVNKNGYFYVLDRKTGEFISGEPVLPVSWSTGLDAKTGRPNVHPDARYSSQRGVIVQPLQAHNTSQMAFNPETGLVYVPISAGNGFALTAAEEFEIVPGFQTLGLRNPGTPPPAPPLAFPPANGPVRPGQRGILSAWDPAAQKERWFAPGGGQSGGGVLTTASNLVIQVTPQGRLIAYAADDGEKLLDIATGQTAGMGPPITYLLDGKQYIALMGGIGLPPPRGSVAPPFPPPATPPASPPPQPRPRLFVFAIDAAPQP